MKKLKQRKGMVGLIIVAAVLFYLGGGSVWRGITHHGKGWREYGGAAPESSGLPDTDEHWEQVSETQYKRECYADGVMFFIVGGVILAGVIKEWREQDGLEKSWKRLISNPEGLQEVHKHPELYRDDFKKWVKENHPHLSIWTLPPNSSN
jgi:hypothetical protein